MMKKVLKRFFVLFVVFIIPYNSSAFNASDVHKWQIDSYELNQLKKTINNYRQGQWQSSVLRGYLPKDPVVKKIIKWREFSTSSSNISFKEITDFIRYNPSWPNQDLLRKNAEYAIADYTNPDEVVKWFAINTPIQGKFVRFKRPLTPKGMQHLAEALLQVKDKYKFDKNIILTLIKDAFVGLDFNPTSEKEFLTKFYKVLTQRDFQRRIDSLLSDRQVTSARRLYKFLDASYKKVFDARIAIISGRNIDYAISQVPYNFRNDPGLLFERALYRDNRGDLAGVMQIMRSLPTQLDNPEKWWKLRKKSIRTLIDQKRWLEAYYLAKFHSVKYNREIIAESEWYAGWIALRFTKNYHVSFQHFKRIYDVSRSPVSIARATYWMGRALEAVSKNQEALEWYKVASRYSATFYGQLGFVKAGYREFKQPLPSVVNKSDVARYRNNELAKAAYLMLSIGEDDLGKLFMNGAASAATTSGERVLVAQMGLARGRYDYSLHVAKEIYKVKNEVVINALFPVFALTGYNGKIIKEPSADLVLSIIRQESEFDTYARSGAGASGLMQLMPETAKDVCSRIGVRYDARKLMTDPRYNITIGSAYLARRIKDFDGSYMLAFAAYNAGIGNVQKWIKKNGDPQKMNIEQVIDWIEMMPFYETSNYVQRALENLQMYRIAVSNKRYKDINIDKDLMR
jgi:soluble lytic murein transglycosylase